MKCDFTPDTTAAKPLLMKIKNINHKGLRRLVEDDEAMGLPADVVPKLRRIVAFLEALEGEDELRAVPTWKAHQLTGDRKGTWALHVTRNWRLTFQIDHDQIVIFDVDFEDYH